MMEEIALAERPHVLVVDDDVRLRELIRRYLVDQGFLVSTAADAKEARSRLSSLAFDIVVLDVMMPGESGLDLTRDLRRESELPILLLTAMGEPEDRIAGLESGADDYLAKPFEPRELKLRIDSILRRTAPAALAGQAGAPPLRMGRYSVDWERGDLVDGETRVRLTGGEAALLRLLAEKPGTVFERQTLAERLGLDGSERSVDVQVTRLRRKLEPDPRLPRYIQTVRGEGYVLRPDGP